LSDSNTNPDIQNAVVIEALSGRSIEKKIAAAPSAPRAATETRNNGPFMAASMIREGAWDVRFTRR
jgi:hypothetical protein